MKHRAYWVPEVQALLALRDLPPSQWPVMAKTAPEVSAALDRAVIALVHDSDVQIATGDV